MKGTLGSFSSINVKKYRYTSKTNIFININLFLKVGFRLVEYWFDKVKKMLDIPRRDFQVICLSNFKRDLTNKECYKNEWSVCGW